MSNRDHKKCSTCRMVKPVEDFYRNRRGSLGRASDCKPCADLNSIAYRNKNKSKVRAYARTWRYGATAEELQALLNSQRGLCPICLCVLTLEDARAHVDHDHKTNKVRGILCRRCNTGLGHFDESSERLLAAVLYLDRARGLS